MHRLVLEGAVIWLTLRQAAHYLWRCAAPRRYDSAVDTEVAPVV